MKIKQLDQHAERNKHKFYKDHYLLITRIFDNRVKSFINNILMADEFVENYSYRIEFQVRGLPHLHGVFWLNETKLNKYKDENGHIIDEKVTELIDDYISVSLESKDESLNDVVRQVNTHKHTKSCQRGNKQCRFDFPKLPSEKTLIAKPLCEETLGKKKFEETL